MTQVDFYILDQGETQARNLMACKVADKAFRSGHQVYVHTASQQQASELDKLLWTFSQGSFAPHEQFSGTPVNQNTPILIGDREAPENWHDVLISLSEEIPAFFSRFERVVEIVPSDKKSKETARERFRFYRDRGYALESHQI